MAEEEKSAEEVLRGLPGKDCGLCGFRTCRDLAEAAAKDSSLVARCVYLEEHRQAPPDWTESEAAEPSWKDMLDRPYDFLLEKLPEDPGPREVILPTNPGNIEKLGVKKGDILYGRPATVGCPVTHAGVVMEPPDLVSGLFVWCVVGPAAARDRGRNVGCYTPLAYEGLVRRTRVELEVGRRYFFMPAWCMIQMRHSGVVNLVAKYGSALRTRVEGIWIA